MSRFSSPRSGSCVLCLDPNPDVTYLTHDSSFDPRIDLVTRLEMTRQQLCTAISVVLALLSTKKPI